MTRTGAAIAAAVLVASLAAQPRPDFATLEKKAADAAPAEKSAALLALSRALEAVDMMRAAAAAREAGQVATKPHDALLAAARLATVQRRQGDYAGAMAVARPALGRAAELGDDAARAELLLIFAQINGSIDDNPVALESYQQLIGLAEKLGNRYLVARGHLGLSVILAGTGDTKQARAEEETVVRIAVEIDDRDLEADGLNNLGNNLRAAGDFDRARAVHEHALALRTASGNRRGVGDSLVNLGEVARARDDLPAALDYTQRAFAVYEELGLKRYQANAHVQFAAILRASHRPDEALAHLHAGLALAQTLNSHLLFANYFRELSLVAEARGDSAGALDAQRRYSTEMEAALGEKSRLQVASLHARYEAERREQEVTRLRAARAARETELRAASAELERVRSLRMLVIDAVVVLFVLTGGGMFLLLRIRGPAARNERPGNEAPPAQ